VSINTPYTVVIQSLKEQIENYYHITVPAKDIQLDDAPDPAYGDVGMGCFFLSRILKKSPVIIAQELSSKQIKLPYCSELRAAGPYLNIVFDIGELVGALYQVVSDDYGESRIGRNRQVMIEYSSPNTNKPQHLGHVRNNVLGMALSNILEKAGYMVIRANLVNDRGIHICKSMLAYLKWGNDATPASAGRKGDHFVGDYYVLFEQKLQDDPSLIEEAQNILLKWENGDKEMIALWEKMNSWVYEGFDKTYNRLGCVFDKVYYESQTYTKGKEIVIEALEKNIVKLNDSGDIIVDLSGLDLGEKVLLRKDGTSIYITQDIGTTVLKFTDFQLDKSIFVVASEQNLHFQVLFYVLKLFGYEWADRCYHLSYGMVFLPEGKMKSREGKVIDADDLMEELHELAHQEILCRSREMGESEIENVAEAVALGALKYFMLKIQPQKDIYFSPKESVSFDGATGPFAQYSYARLSSILRKGEGIAVENPDFSLLNNPEEKRIAVLLLQYPEVIVSAAVTYNPARVAVWIYEMSRAINKFHHDHSVLNTNDEQLTCARLALIKMARQVLGNSLSLLSIVPLEKM